MEITEKWLGDIGGWQAMKTARHLADSNAVTNPKAEGTNVRGQVAQGGKRYAAGLAVRSKSDVENLCTCPTSRARGLICEHSLAVALVISRQAAGEGVRSAGAKTAGVRSAQYAVPSVREAVPAIPAPPPGKFSVFIPPNVLDGSFRGQAAVFLKFEPGTGSASDGRIAAWLKTQGLKPGSMPLMLTKGDLTAFLAALGGHIAVFSGKPSASVDPESRLTLAEEAVRLPVLANEVPSGVAFSLDSSSLKPVLLLERQAWLFCSSTHTLFPSPVLEGEVMRCVGELLSGTPSVQRPLPWLLAHRTALDEALQLRLQGKTLSQLHLVPLPCEFLLQLDGSMQVVDAKLYATFANKRWLALTGTPNEVDGIRFPLQAEGSEARFYARNTTREQAAVQRLEDLGFTIASSTTWRLQGPDKVARFYASELPRLKQIFKIEEGERWRTATRGLYRISPKVLEPASDERKPGNDWLSLDISYQAADGFSISRLDVLQMIRSGRKGMTKDGRRYVIDEDACEEFEENLRDLDSTLTTTGVKVRSDKAQFLLAGDDVEFTSRQAASFQSEEWVREQLPDLAPLLRPYQMEGIRWLEAVARGAKAGLLADDMGLGKTLQSIALIRLLGSPGSPTLVVCPKSLIGNWERELEKFAPGLKVLPLHGASRKEAFGSIPRHHVVITTYQLIVRDLAEYRKTEFSAVVLDEASYIRNPDTEAAKALRQLRATRRFALTGTPLENGVRDLWSIYHFLLPGYLGSRDNFKERFETPLNNGAATPDGRKVAERLRKLVRPFFLRRTKREVLKDLPEKIEQVLWCDLSPAQNQVYRRVLEEGLAEVKEARKRSGSQGMKMTMFTVLLRLRQVCCDLRLTGMAGEALKGLDEEDLSGKLTVWRDRLAEVIEGGGKVIVFSQFVKFLHLLREELDTAGTPYCYLDGQSNDRSAQVDRFQKEPARRVFLISLKAGGYGLNLTAADHVMLMDPWWNPAVEAQAIDRAHRLGQERVVTALRLVTRGTVEEKILKLQAQKRGLIEAALDETAPMMTGLTEEDLEQVLAG